ncbi:Spherulation-specific family 4-domain-containing protein [Mycena maculata]|uniref:Spherulation-specific family 4-domain-containing protein n=1 Tax=Mycena maculata TaxID=230809 RepID=A0AAD7NWE6_9AGAR|nr:Spherulation-specific family 4-domain-containing protein [Mycena maculata]
MAVVYVWLGLLTLIFINLTDVCPPGITTNPTLQFYLVINPDSGPGPDSNPNLDYTTCLPTILALSSNIKLIGYIATGYSMHVLMDILAYIETYQTQLTFYHPSGIFFDETSATSALLSKYTTYVNQVRTASGSTVILNPGVDVLDSYFSIMDLIVTAEDFYNDSDFGMVCQLPQLPYKQGV